MSSKAMRVSARRDGREISSVTIARGCEPVLAGRSSKCAIRLPSDDHAASAVHAKIFWKGASLMIEDAGSRNGVFKDGLPLRRAVKMSPGSLYAVGGCVLSVADASAERSSKTVRRYHRLEFLNGDEAGRIVDIAPRDDGKDFDIGLDPKCSVNLRDLLVSRRHAVLKTNEAGECWIEDLASRNGTYVNGERLSSNERLLRDGDVISIAIFEFRFLDRRVVHTRAHMLFKLGVMMVTVCIVALGYVLWKGSRQPVQSYLAEARRQAAAGNFEAARKAVLDSRDARDYSDYSRQIDAFAAQLDQWKATHEAWLQVKKDMSEGRFIAARRSLDALVSGPIESWGWDSGGMSETKRTADLAAAALRLYFNGKDALDAAAGDATSDADIRVRASIEPIERFLRENAGADGERGIMSGAVAALKNLRDDLCTVRNGYADIDDSIGKISAETPEFRTVRDGFKRIAEDARQSSAVRSYARQQLSICGAFVASQDFLNDELRKLISLDFDGVRRMSGEIVLPNQEFCLRHSRYSDVRAVFAERHKALQREAVQMQLMIDNLAEIGVTESHIGHDIKFFTTANMAAALTFDCLSRPPPNVRRPEPVGMYDTLFGIEYTYESLRALPSAFNGRSVRAMNFSPKCIAARQEFDRVEAFVQYIDTFRKSLGREESESLARGRLGRFYTQCLKIMNVRERLVQWLKEYKGPERGEIVASFYADFFIGGNSNVAKNALRDRFRKLSRELIALDDRYKLEFDPERQLSIRDEIMRRGIPGDQILHSKWAQKFD